MHRIRLLIGLTAALVLSSACPRDGSDPDPPVRPRETRILGIGEDFVTPGVESKPVLETGARLVELALLWDRIETTPGSHHLDAEMLASTAPPGTRVLVRIDPVDGPTLHTPADLQGRRLNDVTVINRFNTFLDSTLTRLADLDLVALSIGREVDRYAGDDGSRWQEYQDFFEVAAAHARLRRPGLAVGVTVSHWAAVRDPGFVAALTASADVGMFTYYPLVAAGVEAGFPDVLEDVTTLVTLYDTKPVFLIEAGLPPGTPLGPDAQGRLLREIFQTWDVYAESIPLIRFRGVTGSGLTTLADEASARGW